MPLVETRYPSVYSLQQLLEAATTVAPRVKCQQADGKRLVSELAGSAVPKITFGRRSSLHRKRIRSSEEAVVPDVDYLADDLCAPAPVQVTVLSGLLAAVDYRACWFEQPWGPYSDNLLVDMQIVAL